MARINNYSFYQVWDLFYESDKVRTMLTRKIQEEALRTYLFTYSKVYDSISVQTLAEVFELDKGTVHAIVLTATWIPWASPLRSWSRTG